MFGDNFPWEYLYFIWDLFQYSIVQSKEILLFSWNWDRAFDYSLAVAGSLFLLSLYRYFDHGAKYIQYRNHSL